MKNKKKYLNILSVTFGIHSPNGKLMCQRTLTDKEMASHSSAISIWVCGRRWYCTAYAAVNVFTDGSKIDSGVAAGVFSIIINLFLRFW